MNSHLGDHQVEEPLIAGPVGDHFPTARSALIA